MNNAKERKALAIQAEAMNAPAVAAAVRATGTPIATARKLVAEVARAVNARSPAKRKVAAPVLSPAERAEYAAAEAMIATAKAKIEVEARARGAELDRKMGTGAHDGLPSPNVHVDPVTGVQTFGVRG
jgi:hypothetical protein